jgi:hypothetical protein
MLQKDITVVVNKVELTDHPNKFIKRINSLVDSLRLTLSNTDNGGRDIELYLNNTHEMGMRR